MLHSVNIQYPLHEIEQSRRRLEAAYGFGWYDRAPVLLGIEARYLLHERRVTFAEYFSDPKTQLVHQLENLKWRIENIRDDWFTKPIITVSPDFQNVANASACGCDVYWQENETPQAINRISTLDELIHHQLPGWRDTLWGKRLGWYLEMKRLVEDVQVRLNGERIPVVVTIGINADSPFMSAVDLAGANFYNWLLEAPDECKTLLHKVTDHYIKVETEFRKLSGRAINDGLMYSDDSAQVISLEQYREFCVPVGQRLYGVFGNDRHDGRMMHLCGRNVHLHEALLNDLHITMLTGYGSDNMPDEMHTLAGRMLLHGNISPMMLFEGTVSAVAAETRNVLESLAPSGGIILGDGYNVVPGSPFENLAAIKKTCEEYGVPPTQHQQKSRD
jgi:uroporphyrinogen-III decarboxylase